MSRRVYCNIKDFSEKELDTLREIGFSTIAGGILVFKDIKVPLEKLEELKNSVVLLNSYIRIKNSSSSNAEHSNNYQVKIWIKLIKRTEKVSLKVLLKVFDSLKNMKDSEYYRNYNKGFCKRIQEIGLSGDWVDRLIRTVHSI